MEKMLGLFEEYVLKAIVLTEAVLQAEVDAAGLEDFTANRERLFSVLDHVSQQVDWATVPAATRADLDRKIEYIKQLDERLLAKLQEHQRDVRREIEATFKQKENLKGYNLNDVK